MAAPIQTPGSSATKLDLISLGTSPDQPCCPLWLLWHRVLSQNFHCVETACWLLCHSTELKASCGQKLDPKYLWHFSLIFESLYLLYECVIWNRFFFLIQMKR